VAAPADGTLRVAYEVYADELTVRTSHLDASHGFANPSGVLLYAAGREGEPHRVTVHAPEGWRVSTALRPDGDEWVASDYDDLADSPLEIGTHPVHEFEVAGRTHRYAVWGEGNLDATRLVADTTRIIQAEHAFWGAVPYPDFTFILHLSPGGAGGLEHRNSTVLLADRWSFRGRPYERFLGLVAHELFHLWNGKRLRPAVLGPFDYTRENYTRELWVVEGITTYYTELMLRRAGIISAARYLDKLGEAISRFQTLPGRQVQTLEAASFDTWIKFYRPDANSPNSSISYYEKGALVALLLDLRIRATTGGKRSLDDVMRRLWVEFGAREVGFPEGAVEETAADVAGEPLGDFFERCLRSTEELPYDEVLAAAGLVLDRPGPATTRPGEPPRPELLGGMSVRSEGGRAVVQQVLADSPAYRAGVNAGDELIALNGLRVGAEGLGARLGELTAGQRAELTVFRRDVLTRLQMEIEPPPSRMVVRRAPGATPEQVRWLDDWLRGEGAADPVPD
jgi:predicted metalloprotease with PDZ domain